MRKGLYILPSVFTAGNIAAGYYAISQAIQGTAADPWHFDHAAKAIGFAIVFDFFDGGIARLDQHHQRLWPRTGLHGRRDCIRRGARGPGVDVGIPHAASGRRSRHSQPRDSVGSDCDLRVSAGRRFTSGAFQHPGESPAIESGPSGTQVFCRNADSGGRGSGGGRRSSGAGKSAAILVAVHRMGRLRIRARFPHGEHLAIL